VNKFLVQLGLALPFLPRKSLRIHAFLLNVFKIHLRPIRFSDDLQILCAKKLRNIWLHMKQLSKKYFLEILIIP